MSIPVIGTDPDAVRATMREGIKPEHCLAGAFLSVHRGIRSAIDAAKKGDMVETQAWLNGIQLLVEVIGEVVKAREERAKDCPTCATKPWPKEGEAAAPEDLDTAKTELLLSLLGPELQGVVRSLIPRDGGSSLPMFGKFSALVEHGKRAESIKEKNEHLDAIGVMLIPMMIWARKVERQLADAGKIHHV